MQKQAKKLGDKGMKRGWASRVDNGNHLQSKLCLWMSQLKKQLCAPVDSDQIQVPRYTSNIAMNRKGRLLEKFELGSATFSINIPAIMTWLFFL